MSKALLRWMLAAAFGLTANAWAADARPDAAERSRIRDERAAANALFAERERECRTRFVVTSCIDDARREQRQATAKLKEQEAVLDDAQRKQRVTERLREIEANQQREEARHQATAAAASRPETGKRRPSTPRVSVRPPKAEHKAVVPRRIETPSAATSAPPDRRSEEVRKKQAFELRQQAAELHRESVERRNAERSAGKKAVAPLPAGTASSAP